MFIISDGDSSGKVLHAIQSIQLINSVEQCVTVMLHVNSCTRNSIQKVNLLFTHISHIWAGIIISMLHSDALQLHANSSSQNLHRFKHVNVIKYAYLLLFKILSSVQ